MASSRLLTKEDIPNGTYGPFDSPTFLRVDRLDISGVYSPQLDDFVDLHLRDKNVLYCHGDSTPERMWIHLSRQPILELIEEFRKSNTLDAVIVCNPGGYQLSSDLLYLSRDSPQTLLFSEDKRLSLVITNFSQENPEIHLPDNILAE
jgi:hypothetical protein